MAVTHSVRSAGEGCTRCPDLAGENRTDEWEIGRYRYLRLLVSTFETPRTVDLFADAMLEWEQSARQGTASKSWSDVHQELFEVDLPLLEEVGALSFDRDAGTVAETG